MFFVTFVAGLLYLFQERELKKKQLKTFYHQLPSLRSLDELFSHFLISGFTFMTLGLLAGVIWAEQDWVHGWQRDPKGDRRSGDLGNLPGPALPTLDGGIAWKACHGNQPGGLHIRAFHVPRSQLSWEVSTQF